jgi:hypothetical protein
VPLGSLPDGAPDWEEIAAEMLGVMADLADPNNDATNGRFIGRTGQARTNAASRSRRVVDRRAPPRQSTTNCESSEPQ